MSNENDPYHGAFSETPAPHAGPQQSPPPPLPPAPPRPQASSPREAAGGRTEFIDREAIAQYLPPATGGHAGSPGDDYQYGNQYGNQYDYQSGYMETMESAVETRDPAPSGGGAHRANYSGSGEVVVARRSAAAPAKERVMLDKTVTSQMTVPAERGWRAALNKVAPLTIGPGKDEQYEISLKDRTAKTVRQTFTVAVINLKGGVGKTVTSKLLGSTLASIRGDKVIAVDLDNDSGNLTERNGRETDLSLLDLVADGEVSRYLDVRTHTSGDKVSQLEVLGQPDFATSERSIEPSDFGKAMRLLRDYYSMVIFDCGTGLSSPLVQAALRDSSAVVVVTSASIDALQDTDQTLEWLGNNGYHELRKNLVLVINHTDPSRPNVGVPKVIEQYSRHIPRERIFTMPFDRHIHEGRAINLKLLSKRTRRVALEIAAALSDMFPKNAG